jgi:hypothetical protein
MASQVMSVSGFFSAPLENTTSTAAVALATTLTFTSMAEFTRTYSGAISADPVSLGTLSGPGAKAILVKCLSGSCTIGFNGDTTTQWPIAAGGGYMLWVNGSQGFVTAAAITTTGACSVVFVALG